MRREAALGPQGERRIRRPRSASKLLIVIFLAVLVTGPGPGGLPLVNVWLRY